MVLIEFLDAQVAEFIDRSLFAGVLDADGSAGVRIVFDFSGDYTVGFAFGEKHLSLKNEIALDFSRYEKEFFVGLQMDFATDDFGRSPFVGVFPTGEGIAVEERIESIFLRSDGRSETETKNGGEKLARCEHGCKHWMLGNG